MKDEPTKDLRTLTEKSVRSHLRLAMELSAAQEIDIAAILREETGAEDISEKLYHASCNALPHMKSGRVRNLSAKHAAGSLKSAILAYEKVAGKQIIRYPEWEKE